MIKMRYFGRAGRLIAAVILITVLTVVSASSFTLDQVPPNADEIYVFFDKDPAGVPVDGTNGWTYDPTTNSVTFHGASCDAVQTGTVTEIDIVYGCPMPPVG